MKEPSERPPLESELAASYSQAMDNLRAVYEEEFAGDVSEQVMTVLKSKSEQDMPEHGKGIYNL